MPQSINHNTKSAICKLVFSKKISKHFTKEELVLEFTKNRSSHLADMYEHEAIELHRHLKGLMAQLHSPAKEDDVLDKKRKNVIGHLKEAGWLIAGTTKADIDRIEEWVSKTCKKAFKVRLNDLSALELSKCIVAAEKVKKHTLKNIYGAGN